MSKAMETLNERLAKGEITEDEYKRISAVLNAGGATVTPPPVYQPTPPAAPPQANEFRIKEAGWGYWLIPVLLVGLARWNDPNSFSQMSTAQQLLVAFGMLCAGIAGIKVIFGK